ncbi:chaperonin 60 beta [Actinidia rufa]|uniref:Chaperonin 60 beta n=1 Tax=Actinidia rufa TaxID=165716 RepID=A0A7J0GB24_9ERIC|nr:chaperonin 60 beta [Actinidia rufa]
MSGTREGGRKSRAEQSRAKCKKKKGRKKQRRGWVVPGKSWKGGLRACCESGAHQGYNYTSEQVYEKAKLKEQIAKLSGVVAVIQVGAQTETDLKEKKLRVEDALKATKILFDKNSVEEGIVVGDGCTLLRLASEGIELPNAVDCEECRGKWSQVVRCCLEQVASVTKTFLTSDTVVVGIKEPETVAAGKKLYGTYENLIAAGIIKLHKGEFPVQLWHVFRNVVRCCLEHAASVAKTVTSGAVVVEIKEPETVASGSPMANQGFCRAPDQVMVTERRNIASIFFQKKFHYIEMPIVAGYEKTAKALVVGLKLMSKEVEDSELIDVAAVSAGNNHDIGKMIAETKIKVGREGVVTLEEGKSAENNLYVVEGMPLYFPLLCHGRMMFMQLLLVDKKITNVRDLVNVLEDAIRGGYLILIIAEDIEQEALSTLVVNKLRGRLKIAATKAPGFKACRSEYLDDIAILSGGHAAKLVLTKDTTTLVSDGSTQKSVNKRVAQIRNLLEAAEQDYEREKLNEQISKLSSGVVFIPRGMHTMELHTRDHNTGDQILYIFMKVSVACFMESRGITEDALEVAIEPDYRFELALQRLADVYAVASGLQKITNARYLVNVLEDDIRGGYLRLIIGDDIEQEALATPVVNKLRRELKIAAIKSPGFGAHKSKYLDDIAILSGGTVIRGEVGLSLDKAEKEVLGHAAKVVLTKDTTTLVNDGGTQESVNKRVAQIINLLEAAEQVYEKAKLKEQIAKLSGVVAVIQAAVEEGIVVGDGCTLLRLASEGIELPNAVDCEECRGKWRSGSHSLLQVLSSDNPNYGYNAATGTYEDLILLQAASVTTKTFLTSDTVVVGIKEPETVATGNSMANPVVILIRLWLLRCSDI